MLRWEWKSLRCTISRKIAADVFLKRCITMYYFYHPLKAALDNAMLCYDIQNSTTHVHTATSSSLVLLGELTPSAQLVSILEHDKRNQAQKGAEQRENETSVLAADVVEEGARKQRRNGTERVAHKSLAGNRRRRLLAVAVGRVRVGALEDEVDTEGDGRETDDGADPRQVAVLGEGVDEETDGEPNGAEHGAVEAVLGDDVDVGVGLQLVVLAHLQVVGGPAEEGADSEGDVGETRDALVPAALLGKGDGDDGQEEEDDGPAKGNPQTESEDDGLGDQHADSLDRRGLQHGLDVGRVDVLLGNVAVVTSGLTDLLSTLVQADTTTGLGKHDKDGDEQGNVGKTLDTFDPSPAEGLVDEAGVDGGGNGTEDGDETEHGHGSATLVGLVHVVKGSTDENSADAAKETEKKTQADDGVDVLCEGETDEKEREAQERRGVDDLASDHLAEGRKDHGCNGAGDVEGEKTELTLNDRGTKLFAHAVDTGAVGGCSETDEEGHEVQHRRDTTLVPWVPVERVLLVASGKGEDNVLLVIVVDHLGESERHVNVNLLDGTAFGIEFLGFRGHVLATSDSPDLGLALLVVNDFGVEDFRAIRTILGLDAVCPRHARCCGSSGDGAGGGGPAVGPAVRGSSRGSI
jgi:hypothetical protein